MWTKNVAAAFSLNQADLLNVYSPAKDTHDSEWRTRVMYKYNTHHHASGTPFGYVNGILIEEYPATANEWMDMLFSVYNSQYKPKT